MDARRGNGYADQDANGHADVDQDAHGNTHLDAHTNKDAYLHQHANLDARRAYSDADQDANEDTNARRAYGDAHEDTDADACEHSDAYADSYAGWLDAGCGYNPILRGKPGLYARLAPNRGGLVR